MFYILNKNVQSQISVSKKKNRFFGLVLIFFYLFLYFFSNNFIYSQSIKKYESEYLIPMGNILQIDAELENIIVRNEVKDCPLKVGDSILKVENKKINTCDDFDFVLSSLNKEDNISVLIKRENSIFCLKCDKNTLKNVNFNKFISGFATLTYINPDNNKFGAVSHSINIGTGRKIPIKQGSISCTTNLNIKKSHRGHVGCLNASKDEVIGEFSNNTTFGIKGTIKNNKISLNNYAKYKVASIEDIKLGKAQIILQNKDNICKKYDIEIINIEHQKKPNSKGIKFKITDPNLLRETGGIVQGMSGTPIVQDDKIIGGVSHALENNPTVGYGVYIKWMLQSN